jgi:O-antigen ligase
MKIARSLPAEWTSAAAIAVTAAVVVTLATTAGVYVGALLAALLLLAWMFSCAWAWLALFLGAVLLLPPLPASFGNSGAHPAVALAAFGLFAAAVFAGQWRMCESDIIAPLTLLTALLALSVPMALLYSGTEVAVGSAVRVALFAVALFVLAYVVWGPARSLADCGYGPAKLLFGAGVASALFACVDFFYQLPAPAGYSPQYVWLSDRVLRRAQGTFYDAGALGNMCCFFLAMVAAAMFRSSGRKWNRWWIAAGAIPLVTALVFSYSRASAVTALLSVAALLWLRRNEVRWGRTSLAVAGCTAAAVVAATLLVPGLWERWFQHARQSLELAFSASDTVLSGRVSSWRLLLGFIADHPLRALAGVGYKTLPYSEVAGQPVIADNTYLSTLIETGAAGLAALLALHAAILRTAYRAARSADATTAFYGSWVFAFWSGEVAQMAAADLLTYWRLLPVFFFVIGLTILKLKRTGA